MASVTLVRPEEMPTLSALQLIKNCRLVENNPALLVYPYQVRSSVPLPISREIVSKLEGKTAKITDINVTGFSRLREKFGCSQFAAKLSKFSPPSEDSQRRQLASPLSGVRRAFLRESFQFVVNGIMVESSVAEKAAPFPAVGEQISLDRCARKFILNDSLAKSANRTLFNPFFQTKRFQLSDRSSCRVVF
jgi:hypothetical protein